MTIQEAIERLSKEKEQLNDAIECSLSGISERNDWGGLVKAIDTVLAELKESKKEGKWKPAQDDEYWYRVSANGAIVRDYYDENSIAHLWKINHNIIFPTKEECEQYWHFMDTVKEKSYEFSKEEWKSHNIGKYTIYYVFNRKEFGVDRSMDIRYFGEIYFKTEEDAQYIIDNFKEELLKYWL